MKIINKEQQKIIQKMIEKYQDKQMIIAVEELSELQKEVCKKLRNSQSNNENLEEEVADSLIVIAQIIMYYNLNNSCITEIIEQKLKRTKERYL